MGKSKNRPKVPARAVARVDRANRGKGYRVPAKATELSNNPNDRKVAFRFDCVDLENGCPWSMASMSEEDHRLLLEKLKEFERMTAAEIRRQDGCFKLYSDFTQCPNREPLDRLNELYVNDNGEIFEDVIGRFRLNGRVRLYGFLRGHEFHILWWDRNHEVWPSKKKHT